MQICLLFFLFLATGCLSETDLGVCPRVTPFAALEVAPYLGRWFEIQRFSFIFSGNQDCVQAIYTHNEDGKVQVHNTARKEDGQYTDIYGKAIPATIPGALVVSFFGEPNINSRANYIVLGTDYSSYASVYSCSTIGPVRTQNAWILSRKYPMDPAAHNAALQHYIDNGIDVTLFKPTYHGSDCPYFN